MSIILRTEPDIVGIIGLNNFWIPTLIKIPIEDLQPYLLKIALKHHNPLYLTLNVCADILSNNVGLVHVNIHVPLPIT
jgi:hypothetical protein